MLTKENVITLNTSTTMKEALEMIEEKGFLTLPVIGEDGFKGCISTYDIYKEFVNGSEEVKNESIGKYMRTDIPVVDSEQVVEKVSGLFAVKNIPFIPVVNENRQIEGIVTQKALFDSLSKLFGYHKGIRLTVHSPEVKGRISLLSNAIKKSNGNIISLVVNDLDVFTKLKEIIVRIEADDVNKVKENIEKEGFRVVQVIE